MPPPTLPSLFTAEVVQRTAFFRQCLRRVQGNTDNKTPQSAVQALLSPQAGEPMETIDEQPVADSSRQASQTPAVSPDSFTG